jgi:hypothetical protein
LRETDLQNVLFGLAYKNADTGKMHIFYENSRVFDGMAKVFKKRLTGQNGRPEKSDQFLKR